MSERELKAVVEAVRGIVTAQNYYIDAIAQAAISASDSKYIKGLVEALKNLRYGIFKDENAVNELIDDALQNLPEDLR